MNFPSHFLLRETDSTAAAIDYQVGLVGKPHYLRLCNYSILCDTDLARLALRHHFMVNRSCLWHQWKDIRDGSCCRLI